jgi:hypothetical protein
MLDKTTGAILKYSFMYFAFNIASNIIVSFLSAFVFYMLRINVNHSPYGDVIETVTMFVAWIMWIVILFILIYDEAYEEFANNHDLDFSVQGALIIATGLFVFAASTQAGRLMPYSLFSYLFYPHCALSYIIGDCFYSCLIMSGISLIILLFARALGKISFLHNYPNFSYQRKLEKQRLKEERKRYYSVDDDD